MQIDTFRDIIHWTRGYHQQLSEWLRNSSESQQDERARMLLDYLADHEAKLSRAITAFEATDNLNALDTWVMEFLNKEPLLPSTNLDAPFAEMTAEQIISKVEEEHNQIVELYKFLVSRASATPAADLLEELADLEKHEAMRLSQAWNRLTDI
ncbi:ATPase [Marinobacterium sp. YM272]|uniref:ATPase n=1 Tax=Marinobacterium sp. YM272 TaxID=3421654 RepID=UPI003D7F486C